MVNQFTASAPGHSGKSALKLLNKPVIGFVANGMITNGAIHGEKNMEPGPTEPAESN